MTTSVLPLLAFGDWTLDINWCTAIVSLVLAKTLIFTVILFPILMLLWIFLREQYWPKAVGVAPGTAIRTAASNSGGARVDDSLGLVYDAKPDQIDDLKEIAGVAGVLEGKLHAFGVYTYRQIALWSDDVAREFGERLAFSDRVFRDRWREQCADLHRRKYGSDPS